MKDLLPLAKGYLTAEGWDVKVSGRDLLRGDRAGRGDNEKEHIYVWVPEHEGGDFTRQGWYLGRFEEATREHMTAEKVFLVQTHEGLSSEFLRSARKFYGVKILAPAQFLDTDFRWERDERTASASKELRDRGAVVAKNRIPQPFHVIQSAQPNSKLRHSDLFDVLRHELRGRTSEPDRPTIHLVVGPAGMGKSMLFDSLYAHLHKEFQDNKRARFLSPRPFALLPEYLDDGSSPTIASLLHNYLRTEFARPMDPDIFNWRLINGLGILLLDGLDEILERDAGFFDYLADLITMPDSRIPPSIVICVRDSLFATLGSLKDFCDDFIDYLTVYRLKDWERESKIAFATAQLRSERVARQFVATLKARPALDELSSTPYYCNLLVDEFRGDSLGPGDSEMGIMERSIVRILERERSKGLLFGVPDEGIREFIESCATTNLFEGGISTDDVQEMADVVTLEWIGEEEEAEARSRLATQLVQMPLFSHGYDGRLRFAQEPLEHYLAASHLAENLQSTPEYLARREIPENVLRLMAQCLHADDREGVWTLLIEKIHDESISGRNAIQLAVRMSAHSDRLAGVQLAGVNLSEIRFEGHALHGINLDGADLTNTDFGDADLTNSSLNGCLIRGTMFGADEDALSSIEFGEMRRFYSAHVGANIIDDPIEFHRIVTKSEHTAEQLRSACGAARQLRFLFGKFVDETGMPRRKYLPERAMLRGRRIVPHAEEILRGAIRAGYFIEVPNRDRISRAEDDLYGEIVQFRTDLQMSSGIRALLDDTCKVSDCAHVVWGTRRIA